MHQVEADVVRHPSTPSNAGDSGESLLLTTMAPSPAGAEVMRVEVGATVGIDLERVTVLATANIYIVAQ